ncbi:MAG: hypothetical protein LJE96_14160 [Deltaproteobacteria bacterium]|nr:hypothetical protein [Deltaproteobacteria bacterium]
MFKNSRTFGFIILMIAVVFFAGNSFAENLSFQTSGEVKQEIKFLTDSLTYTDHYPAETLNENDIKSATWGKTLFVNFYADAAKYFGGYVCGLAGNDCNIELYQGMVYGTWFQQPNRSLNKDGADLALERVNTVAGSNVYDVSTIQIALALAAKNGNVEDMGKVYELIENVNLHLKDTRMHAVDTAKAIQDNNGLWHYGYTTYISDPENSFVWRMPARYFLNTDPLWESADYKHYITNRPGDPDVDGAIADDALGKISWADWKPIAGENGWALLVGPLQADWLRYGGSQGYIPFNNTSMQNAINSVTAFSYMQSGVGAIYYTPGGSFGNGDKLVPKGEISIENNFSILGGLRILQYVLQKSQANDASLSSNQKQTITDTLAKIDTLLNGGTTEAGYTTNGLLSFFYNGAFNKTTGIFNQGGKSVDPRKTNNYEPNQAGEALAVDVDTWGVTALGAATVDSWWGAGTGYKIWKNVKPWGGYYGPDGNAVTDPIWGVGYSDVDKNSVMSAEWTAGAINMVHMLVEYYTANPDGITAAQLKELKDDRDSMLKNLVNMRNDRYPSANYTDAPKPEYLTTVPDGQLAFLYCSKRYFIPFGWFGNPLPSAASTTWPVMLHYTFNPFQPEGSFTPDALPTPAEKDISSNTNDDDPSGGVLDHDTDITMKNQVMDAKIQTAYSTKTNPGSGDWISVGPQIEKNGSEAVTLPKGAAIIGVSYTKDGSNWYGACRLTTSVINDGTEVTAIWTPDPGDGDCEYSAKSNDGPFTQDTTVDVQNTVDGATIVASYSTESNPDNFIPVGSEIQENDTESVTFPAGTAIIGIAYTKDGGANYYGACRFPDPSRLGDGDTLIAKWTNNEGSGECGFNSAQVSMDAKYQDESEHFGVTPGLREQVFDWLAEWYHSYLDSGVDYPDCAYTKDWFYCYYGGSDGYLGVNLNNGKLDYYSDETGLFEVSTMEDAYNAMINNCKGVYCP